MKYLFPTLKDYKMKNLSNDIFSGHPLEITYYEFAKKLFITINEVRRNNPFNYLFKLKLNY